MKQFFEITLKYGNWTLRTDLNAIFFFLYF